MKQKLTRAMNVLGPFLGLLLILGLFSLSSELRDHFVSIDNFRIIFTQTVIVAVGTLGMTLIIITGGIDLSVGSVIAFTSVLGAVLLRDGHAPGAVTLWVPLAGLFVGVINGLAITRLNLTPFIVTLGMLGVARGGAKWLADEQSVSFEGRWINNLMQVFPEPSWLVMAPAVWIALLLSVIMAFVLRKTLFGRYVFAIGSNELTARLCGIRVNAVKVGVYAIAGFLFGIAGLMQLSRLRQGDPTVAAGIELDMIAAAVIGGASLKGGSGSIVGALIGALMMAVLRNGSQQMGWPTYMQEILIGLIILGAVALDSLRHKKP
jgi:ribose transport system permease protein